MEGNRFALFQGYQTWSIFLVHFLSLILFKECTSGDRGKEVHVHIGSKESENILSYINMTHDVA